MNDDEILEYRKLVQKFYTKKQCEIFKSHFPLPKKFTKEMAYKGLKLSLEFDRRNLNIRNSNQKEDKKF